MMLLPIHIAAGVVGLASGFVALFALKGATLHRKSGMLFVCAMLTVSVLGMVISAVRGVSPQSNITTGLLIAYFVITGLVTVCPPAAWSQRLDVGLLLVALCVALTDLAFAFDALTGAHTNIRWMAVPYSIFGMVGMLAGAGDVRMIRSGPLQGASRLARHLWRMSFALLVAALSFPRLLPKSLRSPGMLALPVLVVLVTMVYWLWRLRRGRASQTSGVAAAAHAHPIRPAVATVSAL